MQVISVFIIGEGRVAIEIKPSDEVKSRHTKGLKVFQEEYPQVKAIIVSVDRFRRELNGIEVISVMEFLADLWDGRII